MSPAPQADALVTAIDGAEEGGGVRGGDAAQGVGGDPVVLGAGDPVDELHGEGHALGVAHELR